MSNLYSARFLVLGIFYGVLFFSNVGNGFAWLSLLRTACCDVGSIRLLGEFRDPTSMSSLRMKLNHSRCSRKPGAKSKLSATTWGTTHSSPTRKEMSTTKIRDSTNKPTYNKKHPRKALPTPQQYHNVVSAAFLRHMVFETDEMADWALKSLLLYQNGAISSRSQAVPKYANKNDLADNNGAGEEQTIHLTFESGNKNQRISGSVLKEDNGDPFSNMAKQISACTVTRREGGKIGWVNNPHHIAQLGQELDESRRTDTSSRDNGKIEQLKKSSNTDKSNPSSFSILSQNVLMQLFSNQPKNGDIHKIRSTRGIHLIRVDNVYVEYIKNSSSGETPSFRRAGNAEGAADTCTSSFIAEDNGRILGDELRAAVSATNTIDSRKNRIIANRPNLRGSGVRPKTPSLLTAFEVNLSLDKPHAQTYHISTVGCQMNVADSERLSGVLQHNLGLSPSPDPREADVVILNTCSIRDHAEQKLYDQLGPLAARKRRGDHVAIIVAGCVAQQEGEALLRRVPEVDCVMGPQYVNRLEDLLNDVARGHQVVATDPTLVQEDFSRPVRTSDVRAWVNVIYGCNEHCTYCVVPHVRGVEQSRPMESLLAEIQDLGEAGYKEVTLLGQNIDAYGRDMVPRRTFADLLYYLNRNLDGSGIERIRYVTSHPRYFSDRVIDAVAGLDKVCECFHVPFQSGDDEVLKNMRRGYTYSSYMKIIEKIKKRAPEASICGDVIVGFPGETEQAFQRTLDLMNEVKFDNLNTFAYSPRPNTEAGLWSNQISDEVKCDRLQKVQRLAAAHAGERSERYVGQVVEVLVEERNPRNPCQVLGRTRQGRPVFFEGSIDDLKGNILSVAVTESRPWSLNGVLASTQPL